MEDPQRQQGPADPDPPGEPVVEPSAKAVEDAVSREMLAIHRDSYGRGAERVRAHMIDDTLVVLLDGLQLLPNEEFLLEQGRGDAVEAIRSSYQKAIEPTFRAAVERATGRRVIAFASHISVEEPYFSLEVFRLEPP